MDNSEPRFICTFCLNSAFLRLIRLSFSPTLPSALHYYLSSLTYLVGREDSELTLSPLVVLTDWLPSFPLRRLVGLFRCRFDSVQRTGLRPGCLHRVGDLNKCFCLLTGIASARPSAFVEGAGFEPAMLLPNASIMIHIIKFCALPSSTRPTFQIVFLEKPASLTGGWGWIIKNPFSNKKFFNKVWPLPRLRNLLKTI